MIKYVFTEEQVAKVASEIYNLGNKKIATRRTKPIENSGVDELTGDPNVIEMPSTPFTKAEIEKIIKGGGNKKEK